MEQDKEEFKLFVEIQIVDDTPDDSFEKVETYVKELDGKTILCFRKVKKSTLS